MSLNGFMHPKNLYRTKRPDFEKLAEKYPFFAEVARRDPASGRLVLDFQLCTHVAALTRALFADDFGLDIMVPSDRLIPTLPLRLNYLLWVEEVLGVENQRDKFGIDIGCGACCVYPLLGAAKFGWSWLATEANAANAMLAERAVTANKAVCRAGSECIHVVNVDKQAPPLTSALGALSSTSFRGRRIDFVVCNPPFFPSRAELMGLEQRRSRPPPRSSNSALVEEAVTPGGEVCFVLSMLQESSRLAAAAAAGSGGEAAPVATLYSAMLGRKKSVAPLKRLLRRTPNVTGWSVYELCQGRIMRWAVGWTFAPGGLRFPDSPFRLKRRQQGQQRPLVFVLPALAYGAGAPQPSLLDAAERRVLALVQQLQLECVELSRKNLGDEADAAEAASAEQHISSMRSVTWSVRAREATWRNQRRRRREQQRLDAAKGAAADEAPPALKDGGLAAVAVTATATAAVLVEELDASPRAKRLKLSNEVEGSHDDWTATGAVLEDDGAEWELDDEDEDDDDDLLQAVAAEEALQQQQPRNGAQETGPAAAALPAAKKHAARKPCILQAQLALKQINDNVVLELRCVGAGGSAARENLNALLQFMKNHVHDTTCLAAA